MFSTFLRLALSPFSGRYVYSYVLCVTRWIKLVSYLTAPHTSHRARLRNIFFRNVIYF